MLRQSGLLGGGIRRATTESGSEQISHGMIQARPTCGWRHHQTHRHRQGQGTRVLYTYLKQEEKEEEDAMQ